MKNNSLRIKDGVRAIAHRFLGKFNFVWVCNTFVTLSVIN